MPQKALLKDLLFNKPKVAQVAEEIHSVYPSFKKNEFINDVVKEFPKLELKERINWMAKCLKKYLPNNYIRAVTILIKALPPPNNPNLSDDDFGDFIYAPYAEYVAINGCTRSYLHFSLDALYEMTQRFSAEDAIRYFINAFPEETLNKLLKWSKDSHYHVRRLCSEGTRPKLPWSKKINIPISAPIQILDNLYFDKTRFVTRSVANHINDISKIDPKLAINTIVRWRKSGMQNLKEMDFITRHALRTLIKQGSLEALQLNGYSHKSRLYVSKFTLPKFVKMNTALKFCFLIKSEEDTNVLIDYVIYFQNKSGKMNSKKVFRLSKFSLSKNKSVDICKHHMLRENMTTRTLYPGRHEIEIQANGKRIAKGSFMLKR